MSDTQPTIATATPFWTSTLIAVFSLGMVILIICVMALLAAELRRLRGLQGGES